MEDCPLGFTLLTRKHQLKESMTSLHLPLLLAQSFSAAFLLGFPAPSEEKISFLPTLEEISQQMTTFNVPMMYNNERITLGICLGLIATRRTFYMYNVKTCKETRLKSGKLHAEQLWTIFIMSGLAEAAVQPREHFSQSRFPLSP